MTEALISLLGWTGAIISLYAYFSVSTNKMEGTSFKFQFLNIISAMMIFTNSAYHGALPSATINIVWIGIGILSIVQVRKMKKTS